MTKPSHPGTPEIFNSKKLFKNFFSFFVRHAWPVYLVDHMTLNLMIMDLGPLLGVEITLNKKHCLVYKTCILPCRFGKGNKSVVFLVFF